MGIPAARPVRPVTPHGCQPRAPQTCHLAATAARPPRPHSLHSSCDPVIPRSSERRPSPPQHKREWTGMAFRQTSAEVSHFLLGRMEARLWGPPVGRLARSQRWRQSTHCVRCIIRKASQPALNVNPGRADPLSRVVVRSSLQFLRYFSYSLSNSSITSEENVTQIFSCASVIVHCTEPH